MKKAIENDKETMATTYSSSTSETESIREDINTAMASNQSASEASETMDRLEKDMAVLKNRLKNLRQEANKIFK
jgi:predicted  nucleic acid-binding Zn-ribbon protein